MTAKFLKIVENTLKTHHFIKMNPIWVLACKARKSFTVICAIRYTLYLSINITVSFWSIFGPGEFHWSGKARELATTSKYLEINFTKMLSRKVVTILVSKISIFLLLCQILYRQRLKLIQIVNNKTTDHVKWVRDDSIANWGSGGGDVAGMWGGGM